MARLSLASRPALKRHWGSSSDAPLKKFTLTRLWKAPTATTFPFSDHTGVFHFHSSTRSGAASWISLRRRASILPRQSARSLILLLMRADAFMGGESALCAAGGAREGPGRASRVRSTRARPQEREKRTMDLPGAPAWRSHRPDSP